MTNLEKIEKGLECCTDEDFACYRSCPYFEESNCWSLIRREILDYIRKLEAEVEALKLEKENGGCEE